MKKPFLCLLATCSSLFLPLSAAKAPPPPINTPPTKSEANEIETLKKTSRAFSSAAKKATPAVVYIESQVTRNDYNNNPWNMFNDEFFNRFFGMPQPPQRGQRPAEVIRGSGFFVSYDGYILTNNHVVENAEQITVTMMGGKKMTAQVVGTDPRTDLAVIKIDGKNFPYLDLGNSDDLEVGDWVIAIGNPFGLDATVTVGVVSALGRNQLKLTEFENWIQTDAAINPGNSGGPLLNIDAQVIGINTAIVSASGGYMGIGFAIPSNMAKKIMDQLIQNGSVSRGFLGITMQSIDEALAESFNLSDTQGTVITDVIKGSPADKAGLQQGDVLTQYNGKMIENPGAFRNEVALMPPGTMMQLTFIRDGKEQMTTVTLGTNTDQKATASEISSKLGFEVSELTPELAQRLGYMSNEQGIVVTKVMPGSLAEQAGVRAGNLIVSAGRQQITSIDDFMKVVKASYPNKMIRLLVRQGQSYRYVVLPLDAK